MNDTGNDASYRLVSSSGGMTHYVKDLCKADGIKVVVHLGIDSVSSDTLEKSVTFFLFENRAIDYGWQKSKTDTTIKFNYYDLNKYRVLTTYVDTTNLEADRIVPYTQIDSICYVDDKILISYFYPYLPYFSRKASIIYLDSLKRVIDSTKLNVGLKTFIGYVKIPNNKNICYIRTHSFYLGNNGNKSLDCINPYKITELKKVNRIDTTKCYYRDFEIPLWK